MSSAMNLFINEPPIPPRFFTSLEERKDLANQRDAVIQQVGYPKIQELCQLFSIEEPRSFKRVYLFEKKDDCQKIGQEAFDKYKTVANSEKIAYLCLLAYFQRIKESYPDINSRSLEMAWNFVGGKDPNTVWHS